jgi:hypothetical protein
VGTYRLFPSTSGPSAATSFSGAFGTSTSFKVTGTTWLTGYWWWVCATGGAPTAAQKFCLWQVSGSQAGTVVAGPSVTSGAPLAAGWNYVPLAVPAPLAKAVTYKAATAFSGPFPLTNSLFASGGAYASGITSGPLFAYSDGTASAPDPWANNQCAYQVTSTDPSVQFPNQSDSGYAGWLDLQVTDVAPAGATYRLWPNYPVPPIGINSQTTAYTLATQFSVSAAAALYKIWFYSPPGATVLPAQCGLWNVAGTSVVPGSVNSSPSWSGAAGSGWVSCSYASAGVALAPGVSYKAAVYYGGGAEWFVAQTGYWSGTGLGASGLTYGILSAPNEAGSSPGQSSYATGSWAYPSTDGGGETYYVDVEVAPAAASSGLLMAGIP